MIKYIFSAFFIMTTICFCGCTDQLSSVLAGQWAQFSEERGMVSAAKPGMTMGDVMNKVGEPSRVVHGEMIYSGWQQWIYATGSIYFYRGKVKQVQAKPLTDKQLAEFRASRHNYLSTDKVDDDTIKEVTGIENHTEEDRWALPGDNVYSPHKVNDGIVDVK